MPRLPLRLRQTGFLLGLIVACSDGPHTPAPTPTTPAAPRTDEPALRAPEPAPQVAHSAAPAPSPANSGESAAEGETPESGETGASSPQMGEVRAAAPPPAPSAGSNEETAPPEGSEEEEEEEEEGAGEGAEPKGEEEEEPEPKEDPCDQYGSAWIAARATSPNSISVSWGFSTDPTCGEVETFSVFRDGRRLTIDESDQALTDTAGILPETRYCYEVEATTPDGVFPAETCVTTPPPVPPDPVVPPPSFRTGTITSSSIELLWDEVAGATHYKIAYGTDPNSLTTSLNATGTSHTVTLLSPGTQYHFKARTVNSAGESEAVTASGTTSCVRPAPTRLEAEGVASSDAIDLEWRAPSNTGGCAITYQIDRRKGTSGSYTTIESSWSGTEYRDSNVKCGETYSYKVYTVANGTPGTAFDEADAEVRACPSQCTRPAPPNFRASARTSSDAIRLDWDEPEDTNCSTIAYRIDRKKGSGSFSTIESGWSRTDYTDSGLECGERYYYRVYTVGDGTDGTASTSDDAEVRACPCVLAPAAPSTPTVSVSGNDVTISWGSVAVPQHCTSVNYRLSRSGSHLHTTTDTSHTDTNLSPGTYDYRVLAASHPGDHPSRESGAGRVTIPPPPPTSCQAPETPGSFSTSLSGDTVTVSWDAVPVPAHCTTVEYFVWQGSTKIETTSLTSYADRGLPAGEHCYQVSAASGPDGSESLRTNTTCETVVVPPPAGFTAMAASSSSVDLSWRAASGADSYELRYWDTDDAEPDTWDDLGNVTAHTVTGLEAETEYAFRLRTVDGR